MFQIALERGEHLFVSLHESDEHAENRINDFWQNNRLSTLRVPGWTFEKIVEKDLSHGGQEGQKVARIVESTLLATNGAEQRVLTHIHFDKWPDRSPMPSEELFDVLLHRIAEVSPSPKLGIWINCIGGVGRTGTTAVARYCRQLN